MKAPLASTTAASRSAWFSRPGSIFRDGITTVRADSPLPTGTPKFINGETQAPEYRRARVAGRLPGSPIGLGCIIILRRTNNHIVLYRRRYLSSAQRQAFSKLAASALAIWLAATRGII